MTDAERIVSCGREAGFTFSVNGKLMVAPAKRLTDLDRAEIAQHRDAIIDWLNEEQRVKDDEEVDAAVRIIEARIGPHPSSVAFLLSQGGNNAS